VGCAAAIWDACGVSAGVRWPNDVVCRDRKLGGVLVEQAGPGGMWIIGCGLNINHADFPPDLRDLATSARLETGKVFRLEDVEDAFFRRMGEAMERLEQEGFPAILREWRKLDRTKGQTVRVGERRLEAAGVDEQGRLVAISGDRFEIIEAAGTLVWGAQKGSDGSPAAGGDLQQ
jgi:BirA family biotin operon repressor/biotin-[acetyl-CoA-carboxylase] ligase